MKKTLLSIFGAATILTSAQAQILQPANASFEDWETLNGSIGNTYSEPLSWNTGNECSELINELAVTQSSDAYDGSSSARLETRSAFGGTIKINGIITTASLICLASSGGQEGGSAYTAEIPDSIVGYFKYTPANNDSAYSQIMFLANNDMDTISYTRVNFTETVSQWTRFSAPITPATGGQTPEKLSLFFSSSWGDGAQGEAEIGSVFFIDAVEFVSVPASVNEHYNAAGWNVYPNPAVNHVTIEGNEGNAVMEVLDITGKQVKYVSLADFRTDVDVSELENGIYLYQISDLDGNIMRTGKLLVTH